MDATPKPDIVEFERFRLDCATGGLGRRGDHEEYENVVLGSRAAAILRTLVAGRGALVSKDDLMAAVWPGTAVEESNLTVQISALRRALDEGRVGASCIQTVSGRGYRFTSAIYNVVEPEPDAGVAPPRTPPKPSPRSTPAAFPRRRLAIGGAVLAAFMMAVGILGFHRTATPTAVSDRRQSVIVLPFENSSGDSSQDDLAAGLTRDLVDRIALGRNGPVVPTMTARAYRETPVDLLEIGRKHDVHFALLGNARRQADRVIVSANLYDVVDGEPIWSRHFDLPDGPETPATLMQKVYEGYWQATVDVEASRAMRDHPDHLDKRDFMLAALSTRMAANTKESFLERMSLIDRVLAIDPDDFQGLERQARFHAGFVMSGFSSNPEEDLAIADKASGRLLTLDPNHLLAMRARTAVLRARGDWPAAEAVVRRAIALQPTEAGRHEELGEILMGAGRHREALQSFQAAARLAGGLDAVYFFDAGIAMADLAIGQFVEAIAMAKTAISEFPPNFGRMEEMPWLALIAAMSRSGRSEEAHGVLQRFLATPRSLHSMSQIRISPAFRANRELLDGLLQAGMPAE